MFIHFRTVLRCNIKLYNKKHNIKLYDKDISTDIKSERTVPPNTNTIHKADTKCTRQILSNKSA